MSATTVETPGGQSARRRTPAMAGRVASLAALIVGLAVPVGVWWLSWPRHKAGPAEETNLVGNREPSRQVGRGPDSHQPNTSVESGGTSDTGAASSRPNQAVAMADHARRDPVGLLEACLAHHEAVVRNYRGTLVRQERLGGVLQPPQTIAFRCRTRPLVADLLWTQNPGRAARALYHEGQHRGLMIIRPSSPALAAILSPRLEPTSPLAMSETRYPINEFGLAWALRRALDSWSQARDRGTLMLRPPEILDSPADPRTGGRLAIRLERINYDQPDADGVWGLELVLDVVHRVIIYSHMVDERGGRIGLYVFRDLEFNVPELDAPGAFAPNALGL